MTGLYAYSKKYLQTWTGMLDLHMTTWCEDPVTQRSDCHGWSSLPIYEFSAMTLGVKPLIAGYEKIVIEPFTENHDEAKGTVCTVKGSVTVEWKKENGSIKLKAVTPLGVPVLVKINGKAYEFNDGGAVSI